MQYGIWSIVPPLVTIVLALVLKNVFISLLIGIFLACLILCGFNPIVGLNDTFYGLVNTFASSGNTIVLLSMLLIGALILCFGVYYRIKEGSDAESRKIYTIAAATGAVITVASAIYLVVAL